MRFPAQERTGTMRMHGDPPRFTDTSDALRIDFRAHCLTSTVSPPGYGKALRDGGATSDALRIDFHTHRLTPTVSQPGYGRALRDGRATSNASCIDFRAHCLTPTVSPPDTGKLSGTAEVCQTLRNLRQSLTPYPNALQFFKPYNCPSM